MKIWLCVLGFLLVTSVALAADIDGKWSGQYNSGMGDPMTLTYTFKANGNVLTGTSIGGDNKDVPIKDGKIDGNNISFVVAVDFGGTEMKFSYKGVLSGDEIKLTFEMGGGGGPAGGDAPQGFTVKRVK